MASIHRKLGSSYWYCAFYLPDGRRTLRSTGTTNKAKAKKICLEFEQSARLGREQRFTEARARETIADIYNLANREHLPSSSVEDYLQNWLDRKKLETADSSFPEYQRSVALFKQFLGAKVSKSMDSITLREATLFRDSIAKSKSGGTTNKIIKIMRNAWQRAFKDSLVRENTFAKVDLVKANKSKRRAFTLNELKRILEVCKLEWKGMVLFGVYTGQRLGDISKLTWQNVDLLKEEVYFNTQKTGKSLTIPLAKPLLEYLMGLNVEDDAKADIFPACASVKRTSHLSTQFYDILVDAGLAKKRDHHKAEDGQGREAKRNVGGMSFHCLRHTATSLLKNAGVSDVVARTIIGHDSEAVSRVYTHIETSALRKAVSKLPKIS